MAGAQVSVNVNDAKLLASLAQLASFARNPKPAYADIGEYLVRTTWERFNTQKDPDGKAWQPLKPETLLNKRLDRILVETSRLSYSIAHQADQSGVAVGTNTVYAAIHQFGGTIRPNKAKSLHYTVKAGETEKHVFAKSVTIPARSYLGFSKEDEREVVEILVDWLDSAFA